MSYTRIIIGPLLVALLAASCGSDGASGAASTPTSEASQEESATADETTTSDEEAVAVADSDEVIEWEDTRLFIEYNSADDDYGFHAEFGADPWTTATISGPDGEVLLDLSASGALADHGMSSVMFESAEFPLEEVSLEDFLDRFPQGDYTFVGTGVEGETIRGVGEFTHEIPEPPTILTPETGAIVDPNEVVVTWDPVTEPAGIEIEVYILSLAPVDPPEGQDPIALNIDLTFEVPADIHEIRLGPELFQAGASYQFELLAVATEERNQSYSLGEFSIEPG